MTAEGGHSTGTGVASPGDQDQAPGPARRGGRFWWALPYSAGALAVFLVAGLVIGLTYNAAPGNGTAAAAAPKPAEMFPDALFSRLTKDIQAKNEAAFLSLASPGAQPAIKTWWDNLAAIGFTTGAVLPTDSIDAVHIDSHGDGTTVVLAGVHSPLDPTDELDKPALPMAHYQIGLHFSGPGAIGQITSWRPLDDTPWDGGPLYVRKAAYVVVAGPASDSALVNQVLPAAETASSYDIRFMDTLASSETQGQHGFVLFVSGRAPVGSGWFAADPQPQGWPPQFLGARAVQLPGPGVTTDTAIRLGQSPLMNGLSNQALGAPRVVFTPTGPTTAAALTADTQTLVRVFMLDVLAVHDVRLPDGAQYVSVPSWPQEGFAVMVQALFEGNPNPDLNHYNWSVLLDGLRSLPPSYRSGVYPSAAQLFGPSLTTDEDWGYVAASVYEYIDSRYFLSRTIVAAMALYFNEPTPLGNVYKSFANANKIVFYGIHSIRLGWQPWLAGL
jgi:hypothetical protein